MSSEFTFSVEKLLRVNTAEAAARILVSRTGATSGTVLVRKSATGWSASLHESGSDEVLGAPVQKRQISTRGKVRGGKKA